MSEKTIEINKAIEINDTEIGLRKLPTILTMTREEFSHLYRW